VEQVEIDLPELQEVDPQKIIEEKLRVALTHVEPPIMVEDTSLYLAAMNGLPGPFIKWFLQCLTPAGVYDISQRGGDTNAWARTVIGVAVSKTDIQYFDGEVHGIVVPPRGDEFGWNSIFQPNGHTRTFGEMSDKERLQVSMRRIAAEKVAAAFRLNP
jgi:inosine triphosphate pyrophosphatase